MTQKDKQALLRVRSQARLVRELRERLEDTKSAQVTQVREDGHGTGIENV